MKIIEVENCRLTWNRMCPFYTDGVNNKTGKVILCGREDRYREANTTKELFRKCPLKDKE